MCRINFFAKTLVFRTDRKFLEYIHVYKSFTRNMLSECPLLFIEYFTYFKNWLVFQTIHAYRQTQSLELDKYFDTEFRTN